MSRTSAPMKYAWTERERRFLLKQLPDDLAIDDNFSLITDLYIPKTRLRLRKMADASGKIIARKFTQKYRDQGVPPIHTTITNVYLSEKEFDLLSVIPANRLQKRRYRYKLGEHKFGIDVFLGDLKGLILAEIESLSDELLQSIPLPPFAVCDVTDDPFFTGGNLAVISTKVLANKLLVFWKE